jgi:2-hydroxychromene-2-carboxylate isomerase
MVGSSTARFYFDLASPLAYLAAERVNHALGEVPEWVPVRLGEPGPFRCAEEVAAYREDVERAARAQGVQPLVWPEPFPSDSEWAMLVATYAKQIGRAVAFGLAAFRQAFAAGRDLGDVDNVVLAAAACELHPRAVLKGIESRAVKDALRAATDAALERGVTGVPTIAVGERLFWGDDRLEEAAIAVGATPA